jgi:hypothetical protein
MHQLIFINVAIIVMDTALLSLECASLYLLETIIKGFTYSIKLKLEFAILSRLVRFVGVDQSRYELGSEARPVSFLDTEHNSGKAKHNSETNDISEFVDLTKVSTDYTHAARSRNQSRFSTLEDDELVCG